MRKVEEAMRRVEEAMRRIFPYPRNPKKNNAQGNYTVHHALRLMPYVEETRFTSGHCFLGFLGYGKILLIASSTLLIASSTLLMTSS